MTISNQLCKSTINLVVVAAFVLGFGNSACHGQRPSVQDFETRISDLEDLVADLQALVATQQEQLQHVTVVQGDLNGMPGPHMIIEGCNVHVRNDSGTTDGNVDGKGNLIVGWNEDVGDNNTKDGSHNLVVGIDHSYTNFGGFVAGQSNTISGPHSTVTGGLLNHATGDNSSVGGGGGNAASGFAAAVSGGVNLTASGDFDWVAGTVPD